MTGRKVANAILTVSSNSEVYSLSEIRWPLQGCQFYVLRPAILDPTVKWHFDILEPFLTQNIHVELPH